MSQNKSSTTYKDIVCPFCSLLCDDLSVRNVSEQLTVERRGCSRAIKNFARTEVKVSPSIRGESVHLDEAIKQAAAILRKSKQPLFSGSSTDVHGSRELMALAEKSGAIIDHAHGDAMMQNILVLQHQGWMMTTLAELKNRADLIVFIGTDASSHYPRFFERFIWNQASLAGLKKNAREIVYLGNELDTRAGISPAGKKPTIINCTKKQINEYIAILRALLKGKNIEDAHVDPENLAALRQLAERLKSVKYGVFIWDTGEFSTTDGDITVQNTSAFVKELNQHTRFSGLSLGGNDGGTSFMNVCAWQSGYPLRVNYKNGAPEYDPYSYATKKILREKTADAMLWLSSFDNHIIMPREDLPTIALSRPSKKLAKDAEVYIPVGVPGLDHSANMMRADNVVSLPLKKLREINLKNSSEILKLIRQAL
jgi:formylmethanofuran dehydrogenase subunit B